MSDAHTLRTCFVGLRRCGGIGRVFPSRDYSVELPIRCVCIRSIVSSEWDVSIAIPALSQLVFLASFGFELIFAY